MKGRNSNLIKLRNEYLVKRYYFWYELERLRHDDVLEILETKEVFLDAAYILRIISDHTHLLKELKSCRPSATRLKEYTFKSSQFVTGELFAA